MQKPPHDIARGAPPEAWEPLLRLAKRAGRPLERFLQIEAASGILLFVAAAIALGWANSPWARSYVALWDTPLGVRIGDFSFERSLAWFVNDGLMVVFFFVVGMEIRREIHHGELSEWRRAALPAAAALGGMIVPALLYLAIAGAGPTRAGWGVPMATDIAFAVGVLTLLGKRVPAALRVLLLALAVIDDLGAIVVIALFYSPGVSLTGLVAATLGVLILLAMQAFGVRSKAAFLVPAVILWAGVYGAGIHPTIAGVILGLLTPVRAWLGPEGFVRGVEKELDHLSRADAAHGGPPALAETLRHIDFVRREAMSPAENQIEALHPWVAFVIMPVFALANAGVSLSGVSLHDEALRVTAGASLGLLLGKPIGVMLACALAIRAGVAALPLGLSARHVVVLGVTAGIGFTMALFIAQLAFAGSAPLLAAAKLGVLAASGAATALALALGFVLLREHAPPGTALTADEAEASTEALAGVGYRHRLSAIRHPALLGTAWGRALDVCFGAVVALGVECSAPAPMDATYASSWSVLAVLCVGLASSCTPTRNDEPTAPTRASAADSRASAPSSSGARGTPGGVDVVTTMDQLTRAAAEQVGIVDPVFVLVTIVGVDARGSVDPGEASAAPGGIVGNVTGRRDRSRVALVGLGGRGITATRVPMDFGDASPAMCPVGRVLDIARRRLGTSGPMTVSFQPDIVSPRRPNARGKWTAKLTGTGAVTTIPDETCMDAP